ncbi:MAG: membrane protein insertase YidC [Pseudomonadales bacterium]
MDFQRIFILLGLAVTSYMLVLAWNEDYGQKPVPDEPVEQVSSQETPAVPTAPVELTADEIPDASDLELQRPTPTASESFPSITPTKDDGRSVSVKTDVLEVTIDRRGGDIKRVNLPAYPERINTPDVPFPLIDSRNNYAAQSGLIGTDGTDTSAGRPLFETMQSSYELTGESLSVDLRFVSEDGVVITKRFTFKRGDYLIDVEYIIDNPRDTPWSAAMFGQIKRDSQKPAFSDENSMGLAPYVGGATFVPGSPYTKLTFDDIAEEPYKQAIEGGYVAMVQHYFLSAWVPSVEHTHTYRARKLANQDTYLFEFTTPVMRVPAGETGTIGAAFYAGPKDQYRLKNIAKGLDLTVDYGFLWWLAQPLFDLLFLIHGFVGNWGVAIILLTIIVKTVLYPLSAASFRSMAKMRKLQPEMQRLKERYGDDRQQFSQAMMELYKKEGANPLGGCFPILLQMPVFLALYWTLLESVELRQAPFMLWIHDLSDMDPYFVLPILMGISMYLTQLMQPEPPDPMQAKIFKLMPIMFTFFFLWFPSGLVLYWLVNNILSIMQQYYVKRQIEKA